MVAKAQAIITQSAHPTEKEATASVQEVVFFALPAPLFKQLSDAAAKKQLTLAQFLANAVSVALRSD